MRTLVISDLHLGGRTGVDVLVRDPDALRALTHALRDVDRLVLLGDTLELRHGPAREALAAAQPVLETIGDALPPDSTVVLVPGNHDYALAAPWLDARTQPLGLEAVAEPPAASPIAGRLSGWLNRDTEVAYPGLWLRDDVWATHGHYLDPHGTVPTFERLAAGVMGRMVGTVPAPVATAEDYERILAPLYAWIHASAQRAHDGRVGAGAGRAGKAYTMLSGDGHRPLKLRLLGAAFPLGIRGVNLLKIGPVSPDLSGDALRRNALDAMTAVLQRLQVDARHVVFGHSHRAGPLPADAQAEWRTPAGTKLYNSGSWVHEPSFTGAAGSASPYWPGGAVLVADEGEPELLRLLG